MKLVAVSIFAAMFSAAQQPATQETSPVVTLDQMPVFRTTVVSRTAKALNYRHRSGATKVDFEGLALAKNAHGEAKVESKKGYIEIEVEFSGMRPAQELGPPNLTYVLWAISPEGRAANLGELLLDPEGRAKVNVTTELQAFGMVVTAEPYFAVTQPSNRVVLENVVRKDTLGKVEDMTASYDLLDRVEYPFVAGDPALQVAQIGKRPIPLELKEAAAAVQIARWTGADKYAAEQFRKAGELLKQSEDYHARKQFKPAAMIARQAVQTAEDARLIAVKRIEAEKLEAERKAAADREASERAKAAESARLKQLADENARQQAERRALAEEQQRLEAARRAQAEQDRAAADAARMAAEKAKLEAQAAQQLAAKEKAEAEAARAAAIAQQQALAADVERARAATAEAERLRVAAEGDREKLRQQLLQQFNLILETTDTPRGLVVNMSDVLFDFGKYTLKPVTREKLARLSGIVLGHPGLKLDVEGHTDNIGSDEFNQRLSEQRAGAVRDYLVSQSVPAANVTATGLGKTMPVAPNTTGEGRQRNRRVELVVSGEVIGTNISGTRTPAPSSPR